MLNIMLIVICSVLVLQVLPSTILNFKPKVSHSSKIPPTTELDREVGSASRGPGGRYVILRAAAKCRISFVCSLFIVVMSTVS